LNSMNAPLNDTHRSRSEVFGHCGRVEWRFHVMCPTRRACVEGFEKAVFLADKGPGSFSLVTAPGTG
jgi:hypothetical protein